MALANIQDKLNDLEPGSVLALEPGDYGPCIISKAVTILGDGATFWTDGSVPAITIQNSNVVIKNASLRNLSKASHVVFLVGENCQPLLQNVRIQGVAMGVEPDTVGWLIADEISAGQISAIHPGFHLDFAVPQRSQIVCRIAGVSMDPSALTPGVNTVKLQIRDAMPDTILVGEVEVIGNIITRIIPFFARISSAGNQQSVTQPPYLFQISQKDRESYQKALTGSGATRSAGSIIPAKSRSEQGSGQKQQEELVKPLIPQKPSIQKKNSNSTDSSQVSEISLPRTDGLPSLVQQPQKLGLAFSSYQDPAIPLTASIRDLPAAPSLTSTVLGTLFTDSTASDPTLEQSAENPKSVISGQQKQAEIKNVTSSKPQPLSSLFMEKQDT